MRRDPASRALDAKRVADAARALVGDAVLARDLQAATGLSPEGVHLALEHHLETDPSPEELARLVARTAEASSVHVVLSANVFVGALRAVALALAASEDVTVRPSRREPAFTAALVAALADPRVRLAPERVVEDVTAGEIHVYGRDATVADVRARARRRVTVRGHGAGLGVALVEASMPPERAATLLAEDVVPFDQRGCLSPRVAFVEGDADAFAAALDAALGAAGRRVPRGELAPDERAGARRWLDTMAFAGRLLAGEAHAVGVAAEVHLPPPGRHVVVVPVRRLEDAPARWVQFAHFIAAAGATDPERTRALVPAGARLSALGAMQRPPLDGPVDLRHG